MSLSIREEIIANMVQAMREAGGVRGVTDEEPFDYRQHNPRWAWVFEGDEVQDNTQLVDKTECTLTVCIHETYAYLRGDSERDIYKLGRRILAERQRHIMEDHRRGGWAWLTLEQKNSIGRPAECEERIAILATEWSVKYHRNWKDPFSK